MNNWREATYYAIGIIIGIVFHEYMHARMADWRGDHTARNAGRLTLNPIPHIDPFGTVLLPLVMLLFSGVPFGYAKPVPVNPFFLKQRKDMVLVALAGPLTNFSLALAVAFVGRLVNIAGIRNVELYLLLYSIAVVNVVLGVFNLIPVPPLDGSHILEYYLPPGARARYDQIAAYGFILIFPIVLVANRFLSPIVEPLRRLILRIMGVY